MTLKRLASPLSILGAVALSACAPSGEGTAPPAAGGMSPSNGGSTKPVGNGGQTDTVGGAAATSSNVAQSGATTSTTSAGSTTSGTAQAGGSISASGGAATGGSNATALQGGATATGGAIATGGKVSAGGTATGGSRTNAGGAATGGNSSSATTTATGGSQATGGATNSGSCVESTCGSHKWPCWRMPTPVSENLPNAQNYTDLGNGAVRDNITCLVWEKANSDAAGSWQATADRCTSLASSNFAGFSDWRMPTRVEMASITDVTLGSKGYPTIFTTTSGYYSTKSYWYKTILSPSNTNRVWGYGTNGYTSNAIVIEEANKVVRCVRGNGNGEAYDAYAVEPPDHYTVTGSGTDAVVKDNYTGLIWQQTYSTSRMAWSAAASYCSSQTTGGLSGWRVPTLTELASTVNEALVAPAINRTVFPNTNGSCDPDGWFWAAEASKVGGTAWGLSYCDGYTGWNAGSTSSAWNYFVDGWVRCVHN